MLSQVRQGQSVHASLSNPAQPANVSDISLTFNRRWHGAFVGIWLCVGWPGPGHATSAECLVPIHWVLWSNSKSHPMVYYVHHAVPDIKILKSWHLLVCLFNVGAASTTPSHHQINIGPMSCLLGCLRVTIYHQQALNLGPFWFPIFCDD